MHPVTPYPILDWFLWGFFMGFGWAIATWLWGKITLAAGIQ